jgi:hypothetical protein
VADKLKPWDALHEIPGGISDLPRLIETILESPFLVAQKWEISYSFREFGSERLIFPF